VNVCTYIYICGRYVYAETHTGMTPGPGIRWSLHRCRISTRRYVWRGPSSTKRLIRSGTAVGVEWSDRLSFVRARRASGGGTKTSMCLMHDGNGQLVKICVIKAAFLHGNQRRSPPHYQRAVCVAFFFFFLREKEERGVITAAVLMLRLRGLGCFLVRGKPRLALPRNHGVMLTRSLSSAAPQTACSVKASDGQSLAEFQRLKFDCALREGWEDELYDFETVVRVPVCVFV
jgi:hypothetical protein